MEQLVHFLLLSLFLILPFCSSHQNDTASLLRFRFDSDPHGTLLSNWTSGDACAGNWIGVRCSGDGRVFSLSLPSLNLRGPLVSLSSLDQLRLLDLHDNRLNGTVLPLSSCANLKLVYLSRNDFSGRIPPDFGSLRRLRRLDISDNNLVGPLPNELSNLTRLITLRLDNNVISGRIPDFAGTLPELRYLNLSNNDLVGPVPTSVLLKFGENSFTGNQQMCGSSCSFKTDGQNSIATAKPRKVFSNGFVIWLLVINSLLILVIVAFILVGCCRRFSSSASYYSDERESVKRRSSSEKRVYAESGQGGESEETDKSRLVFFERRNKFELEDLLRASAEMLGKGCLGTVYKAVLEDGSTVAVKRLKDANPCGRKEFEQYMDVIGRVKHPNIVRLRAYYYAREEKLLVYDYMSNGSLHSLLHENRGPGRIPLDWTTRISLVLGSARGLARIHAEYSASKIPHGNIKSSNILLDNNGVACIGDFGLSLLLNPAHAIARLGGYKSPEQAETNRLSQQADVYGFGVLLLEVLTGKSPIRTMQFCSPRPVDEDLTTVDLPKWVGSLVQDEWTAEVFDPELLRYKNIEEELVAMLHVAMVCVAPSPEKRPTMMEVVKMVEEIRVEQSPIGEEFDESRNSLSTDDAVLGF